MSVLPQFITQFLSTLDKYCVVLLTVLSCDCIVQSKISMLAELTSFMMLHAFPLQNPLTIIPHTLHYDKTHVMSINLSGDNNIGLVWRMIYTSKQFWGIVPMKKNTILFIFSRVFNHSTCICFKAKYKQVIVITIIYSFCLGQFLKTSMHICLLFIVVTQEVWD
jgi:hypothetical protein